MSDERVKLEEMMKENDLTSESCLYRYSLPEFLSSTEEPDVVRISANSDPSEAIVDVYQQGHVELALHVGPGLAFSSARDNEWASDERKCVSLRLRDALDQGGRLYPVESITTEKAWYVTLPEGGVRVRIVGRDE